MGVSGYGYISFCVPSTTIKSTLIYLIHHTKSQPSFSKLTLSIYLSPSLPLFFGIFPPPPKPPLVTSFDRKNHPTPPPSHPTSFPPPSICYYQAVEKQALRGCRSRPATTKHPQCHPSLPATTTLCNYGYCTACYILLFVWCFVYHKRSNQIPSSH